LEATPRRYDVLHSAFCNRYGPEQFSFDSFETLKILVSPFIYMTAVDAVEGVVIGVEENRFGYKMLHQHLFARLA
jgi:hypothetical protein